MDALQKLKIQLVDLKDQIVKYKNYTSNDQSISSWANNQFNYLEGLLKKCQEKIDAKLDQNNKVPEKNESTNNAQVDNPVTFNYDDIDELDIPVVAARDYAIHEFKSQFFENNGQPKSTFSDNFSAEYTHWNDIKDQIHADVANQFGPPNNETFKKGFETTFTGRVFDLYTEITVTSNGELVKAYFEVD